MKERPGHWQETVVEISTFAMMKVNYAKNGRILLYTKWEALQDYVIFFALTEQVLVEHGAQTPPPSPFSVPTFNRPTTSNGAQGFDYGLSNNKGDVRLVWSGFQKADLIE